MENTPNPYYWPAAPNRRGRKEFSSTSRAMLAARRYKQQRAIFTAACVLVALFLIMAASAAFTGVEKAVATWHTPAAPKLDAASAVGDLPNPLPGAQPAADARPVRILLLGSDQRGEDRSYRTDVIVLVTIDPANLTASAVSFPRDLWVEPPTLYPMKINMIQAIGGFDAMAAMFEANFGVRPDYFVQTNFNGFSHLIDNIGGIDVHAHEPLTDSCDLPQAPGGICRIEPGVQTMDGATALWYVRSRESTSDFDRLRRAQEVVQAVFERMMNLNVLLALPQAYGDLTQDLETNMGLGEITPLVPVAVRLFQEPERIGRYAITEEQAYPSWSWDGMWILLPDQEAIRALLEEAGALR